MSQNVSPPMMHVLDLDMPEQNLDFFNAWYAGRHSADLYHSNFDTVTSYKVTEGDMSLFDLYQIPCFETLVSEPYTTQRGLDPYAAEAGTPATNAMATLYEYAAEGLGANSEPSKRIDSDWLTMVRFDADDAVRARMGEFLAANREKLEEQGVGPIRLLKRGPEHPVVPSTRPNAAVLLEWTRPALTSAEVVDLLAPGLDGLSTVVTNSYRLFPWPNDRSLRD